MSQPAVAPTNAGDELAVTDYTPFINTGWKTMSLVFWPASDMGDLWGWSDLVKVYI